MKSKAFTLAEVLITLAIIGVVAALTIPAVVTKATKQKYVTSLQKAYNTLKAVIRESERDNGELQYWDWGSEQQTAASNQKIFNQYFRPYFDIMLDCGTTADAICFARGASNANTVYKALDGKSAYGNRVPNDSVYYKIITSDGISYAFLRDGNFLSYSVTRSAVFAVDVNGREGPNIAGRDLFTFELYPSIGIKPFGIYSAVGKPETSDKLINEPLFGCNPELTGGQIGSNCAARVLSEGAMNY